MTKVFVLGIDALEYDLVEKWDLKNLKQEECGKVEVPIDEKTGGPLTGEVWGSFLTGEEVEVDFEHGNVLIKFLSKLKNDVLGLDQPLKEKLRIGSSKQFKKPEVPTFLDQSNSSFVNVPFYDFKFKDSSELHRKFVRDEITVKGLKKLSKQRFKEVKERVFEKIGRDEREVFMCYFHILDDVQHSLYTDKDFIKEFYQKFDKFVSGLKEKLDEDVLFLVISDHGQKVGEHTPYGFYSSNKDLGLNNPHITDFYDIIMEELGLPTREDKENIKENLQELGYI